MNVCNVHILTITKTSRGEGLALGVSKPAWFAFFRQIHAVSSGNQALIAALETCRAFASVIACGIASFELLCAWRLRFQARASCATRTSSLANGLGVEGSSCSTSHNPGGDRAAMLRQGPLFNLLDVSLRIRHTSFAWTTVHGFSGLGFSSDPPRWIRKNARSKASVWKACWDDRRAPFALGCRLKAGLG